MGTRGMLCACAMSSYVQGSSCSLRSSSRRRRRCPSLLGRTAGRVQCVRHATPIPPASATGTAHAAHAPIAYLAPRRRPAPEPAPASWTSPRWTETMASLQMRLVAPHKPPRPPEAEIERKRLAGLGCVGWDGIGGVAWVGWVRAGWWVGRWVGGWVGADCCARVRALSSYVQGSSCFLRSSCRRRRTSLATVGLSAFDGVALDSA